MSIFPPHLDAATLFAVCLEESATNAATLGLLALRDCIIPETDVADPRALGGLMIPNMPF